MVVLYTKLPGGFFVLSSYASILLTNIWNLVIFMEVSLQDMLLLACTHPENRTLLTTMPEWPEWLLEVLISNYEVRHVTFHWFQYALLKVFHFEAFNEFH